jgi:hypothetical protein
MKCAYFREQWKEKPDWIAFAETSVDNVWKESYRGYRVARQSPVLAEPPADRARLSQWDRKRQALNQADVNIDMMERFQQDLPLAGEQILDVVSYWRTKRLEPQWRDLARMALDYLTIPAMSAEPERVFSAAKITLTDRRCRMGDDAIEALECLKSWQRDGLIAATKQDIRVIEDMLNALCEEDLV